MRKEKKCKRQGYGKIAFEDSTETELENTLVPYGHPLPFHNEALPLTESSAQAVHIQQ